MQSGERRFACQCGTHYTDASQALTHTIQGHEVVMERFTHGEWAFHPQPISEYIIELLEPKLGGEGMEAYVSRLERLAESVS